MNTVTAQLELVQSRTLTSLVQQEIVRMIRDGELLAGSKLVEASFTDRLGINRASVREAFRALEEAGLVRLEKNRGVSVREFSETEAVELYEMRAWLEEVGVKRLARSVSRDELSELNRMNSRLGAIAKKKSIGAYYPLNIEFHDALIRMTKHSVLSAAYQRLTDQMHLLRRKGYEDGSGLTDSHREHAAILDALAKRDDGLIVEAVQAHARNGMRRFLDR